MGLTKIESSGQHRRKSKRSRGAGSCTPDADDPPTLVVHALRTAGTFVVAATAAVYAEERYTLRLLLPRILQLVRAGRTDRVNEQSSRRHSIVAGERAAT
jgi:hypothetical protein